MAEQLTENNAKAKFRKIYPAIVMPAGLVLFTLFSILFIFIRSNVFPILNFVIVLALMFVRLGKYRVYLMLFYMNSAVLMTLIDTKIGTFYTWTIVVYFLSIFVELLADRKHATFPVPKIILIFVMFAFYMLIVDLINLWNVEFIKVFSQMLYYVLPLLFILDRRSEKDLTKALLIFAAGLLFANLFAFTFLYANRQLGVMFLKAYLPDELQYYERSKLSDYRFVVSMAGPGSSDTILLTGVLLVLVKTKKPWRYVGWAIAGLLQIFCLLSGSKTYILAIGLCLLIDRKSVV